MFRQIAIPLPLADIHAYCNRLPVRRLAVFGSALGTGFNDASDLDLLVEYFPDARVTLLDMAQQEIDLSAMIGRQVDLRTPHDLSRYFRQRVMEDAVVIYERAKR